MSIKLTENKSLFYNHTFSEKEFIEYAAKPYFHEAKIVVWNCKDVFFYF